MKAKRNLLGKVTGYVITPEEVQILRKCLNHAKRSKTYFDALAILNTNEED